MLNQKNDKQSEVSEQKRAPEEDVVDYKNVKAEKVIVYNHPGNKLTSMLGFSTSPAGIDDAGKDVAMQVAAMAPVAIDKDDVEKQFIKDLGEEIGIFKLIQKNWKEVPLKREKDELLVAQIKSMSKKEIYERDRDTFPDIRGEIPASKIEEYYNKKDTYYVNVGTHGFYLMGRSNPLKLKELPTFGSSAKATYRARVQYKGNDNYQFTFEMQFSIPSAKKSPYNIAPVDGKSVTIKQKEIDLGCFV